MPEIKKFIITPEFITHPIFYDFISNESNEIQLCIPSKYRDHYFPSNNKNFLLSPLLRDDSYNEKLLKVMKKLKESKKIKELSIPEGKEDLYNQTMSNFMQRIEFLAGSQLYETSEFVFHLLCLSYFTNTPLLLANSSESRIVGFFKRLNELVKIYHKPALLKLINGDEDFPDRRKEYIHNKHEAIELIFTPEGRGLLFFTGAFCIISHVFLEPISLGLEVTIEVGWFIFYDP